MVFFLDWCKLWCHAIYLLLYFLYVLLWEKKLLRNPNQNAIIHEFYQKKEVKYQRRFQK